VPSVRQIGPFLGSAAGALSRHSRNGDGLGFSSDDAGFGWCAQNSTCLQIAVPLRRVAGLWKSLFIGGRPGSRRRTVRTARMRSVMFVPPKDAKGKSGHSRAAATNPTGPDLISRRIAPGRAPSRIIKGGSDLCSINYCSRYRARAR
jgi:hypothetical protein